MPSKRNAGRVQAYLAAIAKMRSEGTEITRECLAYGKNHLDSKGSWPVHSIERRSPSTAIRPPIEGEARLAFARQTAGLPLSEREIYVLEKYPDGGPWQKAWEEAAREHQSAIRQEN